MSRLLSERLSAPPPLALSRIGPAVSTERGTIVETAGGSHASCIVHDRGSIVTDALERLRQQPFPATSRSFRHPFQDALADSIVKRSGDTEALAYFTSGGTEAVETAVRLAYHIQSLRGRPNASIVIGRTYSYHGMSLLARNLGHHPVHSALPAGVDLKWPKLPEPRCTECPMDCPPDGCNLTCADVLDDTVRRLGPEHIAAVIAEPVSGTTGAALVPPPGYLERLASICRRHGILFIADETVTAFGRTGKLFATGPGVADILVGGKCLGGGFAPINAVIVSSAISNEVSQRDQALPLRLTFAGNPLCCVIAICVQEYMARLDLGRLVDSHTTLISSTFKRLCANAKIPANISGVGHLWSIQLPVATGTADRALASLKLASERNGAEFMGGLIEGRSGDFVHMMFTPAFDLTDPELQVGMELVVRSVADTWATVLRS